MASEPVDEVMVKDVMKTPVITIEPFKTVKEAAEIMVKNGVGSLVVTDDKGRLLGIVTRTDIIKGVVAKGRKPEDVRVSDIMTKNPIYVFEDISLREAASIMGARGIGHLPVIDPKTGQVVGIISKRDIVRIAPHFISLVYAIKSEAGML